MLVDSADERKQLLIIGAGGLGRIVLDVLGNTPAIAAKHDISGMLDTRADPGLPADLQHLLLGDPLHYQATRNQVFIAAVGLPAWREKLVAPLLSQNATFISYQHGSIVGNRSSIGVGAFLTPGTVISVDCDIGDFAYMDTHVVVGHDVTIGRHCMIGAMSFLAGGVRVGDGVSIHPRSTIAKGVQIGDGATVGIGSVVVKDVPAGTTVFGNPARVIYA